MMDFAVAFRTLIGHSPFRWQERRYHEHFAKGDIPSACCLPTGLVSTASTVFRVGATT